MYVHCTSVLESVRTAVHLTAVAYFGDLNLGLEHGPYTGSLNDLAPIQKGRSVGEGSLRINSFKNEQDMYLFIYIAPQEAIGLLCENLYIQIYYWY